jgi:hypothetical protein
VRISGLTLLLVLAGGTARAACPPDCLPGGGPAATDCFVAWSGIAATRATCVDGEACDADGQADGACTFPLQAGLDPAAEGCSPAGLRVPLRPSVRGIRPVRVRLAVIAQSGGRRDRDRLVLTCQPSPSPPSFSGEIVPLFAARCVDGACHNASFAGGGLDLEAAAAWDELVGARAEALSRMARVKPGSVRASFLARKILGGRAIPRGGNAAMPFGCPSFPPPGGCLEEGEVFAILSWIQNGAPRD